MSDDFLPAFLLLTYAVVATWRVHTFIKMHLERRVQYGGKCMVNDAPIA